MKKVALMLLLLLLLLGVALPNTAIAHMEGDAFITDLIAGGGNPASAIDVGDVLVWNDADCLYVKYVTTDDWYLTEVHLQIALLLDGIPQKNGNPVPGHFEYVEEGLWTQEYLFEIPLIWDPCADVYIAAHAVVERIVETCIDFESFQEKDFVSSVSTPKGAVDFYMTSKAPLVPLVVGDSADLTPSGFYPMVAAPDTSPPYENIVAFTVVYPGNPYRDDYVKDDGGTGAGGKTLTDPQDLSQTPLLYHAYAQGLAIVIDVSAVEAVQGLDLAAIDLDWTEVWYFLYFDGNDVLMDKTPLGPPVGQSGDGVAYAVEYPDPVSKVAIWGGMNLGQEDRVGYAIDNICVTSLEEETAWGDGLDFPGKNWATYFTYHVQFEEVEWPEGGTATVAFEDLPIGGGNDYDYNNFVTDVSVVGYYSKAGMVQLKFTFDAQARGAAYHHDLHLLIPASTFGSGGLYTIESYETDGSFISSTSGSFVNTANLDLTVFADTWDALPPNPGQSWSGNTYDGSGLQLGRRTIVNFEFTTAFSFDLSTYTPDYVGVHGDNLFFDPYLYVWNTGQSIHITDSRLTVVPTDWEWPQETAAIWTVYPYNTGTGEGVTAGNPPTFTTYWYTEPPTTNKWTP